MDRLGEILIAKGAVSADGLRSALEACRRNGGRLGTWLVRLGFVNEQTLLEALSEQTGCPTASALDLATAPAEVRAAIPPALARRHMVVAFGRQGRHIDVAMSNPSDVMLIEEIASLTRSVVRPHVATEAALSAALAIPVATTEAAPLPPARTAVREWRQFWRMESALPEIFRTMEPRHLEVAAVTAASFPDLAALGVRPLRTAGGGTEELAEALANVGHRDRAAALVLSYLHTVAPRAALFSFQQNRVVGWAATGPAVDEDDLRSLVLPLDQPSLFLNLTRGAEFHVGPLGGGNGHAALFAALGPPPPREAAVVPVRVRGKVAAFVWVDALDGPAGDLPMTSVREVARLLGLTLEVLVLRQKIRAGTRLTEGPGAD